MTGQDVCVFLVCAAAEVAAGCVVGTDDGKVDGSEVDRAGGNVLPTGARPEAFPLAFAGVVDRPASKDPNPTATNATTIAVIVRMRRRSFRVSTKTGFEDLSEDCSGGGGVAMARFVSSR